MTMTRKQFLRSVLGVGAGAVGVAAIASCGGGDDGGSQIDAPPAGACTSPNTAIGSNHGHQMSVTIGDVNAAANKTYDIRGSASHTHSVTITANQFTGLEGGQGLNIQSTTGNGHTHTVNVTCTS
jgi:hypothetical protein